MFTQQGLHVQGLTPKGERMLEWVRRVRVDCDGADPGRIPRRGAIPTMLAVSPLLTPSLQRTHPGSV